MEPEPLNQVSTISLEDPSEKLLDAQVWLRGGPQAASSSAASITVTSGKEGLSMLLNKSMNINRSNYIHTDIFTKDFLRRYIHFAKNRMNPELSDDAMEAISLSYANMRAKQTRKNLPVTARTLETVIRLASAHAKLRLSESVDVLDVENANELLNYVLYHEIGERTEFGHKTSTSESNTSKSRNVEEVIEDVTEDDNELDEELKLNTGDSLSQTSLQSHKRSKTHTTESQFSSISLSQSSGGDNIINKLDREDDRVLRVFEAISEIAQSTDEITIQDIVKRLNQKLKSGEEGYQADAELEFILQTLQSENKVSHHVILILFKDLSY